MITDHKKYVNSDEFKKELELELGIEISKKVDDIDPVKFINNFVNEAATNENMQSDMYLQTFLDKDKTAIVTVIELLLKRKLFIYHAPFSSEIITSDNPGCVILLDDRLLSFGGFGLEFKFLFPLTSKCCLLIQHDVMDNTLLLKKDINVLYINKTEVDAIYNCTYHCY